jgi:hypothetical protein
MPQDERKRLVSEVQCDALLQVLRPRKDWAPLSDEQRAHLVEMTCASGFHDDDQARALKAIAGIKSAPSRRNQQDATHHASYISGPEWEGIGQFTPEVGKATPDLIYAQAILDILVCRMGVVNPSEPTLKAVTSNALVLAHGSRIGLLTYEDKMALLSWIRKKLKAMVRLNEKWNVTPIEYCENFPVNSCDLEAIHPKLYSKLKIPGCWTDSRVNTQLYSRTYCTFSCRRNGNSVHEQQIVPAVQGFDMNKLMFGMMQKMLRQNADDDEDGIFTYNMPGRRKRSIDGLEQRLSLKRRRSSFGFGMDDEEEEHEEPPRVAGAQAVGKAASVGKAPPVGPGPRIEEVPEFGEPPAEEGEEPAVEEASAEEVEESAVPALAIVKAAVAKAPVVAEAQEPPADELWDAIIQREAERAEAAKVAAAAKRAAAAAAKKEAAQLEKAEAAKAAEAAKEAAPADGEAKLPVKAGAKPPAAAKPSAVGKPPRLCGKPPGLFGKRPAVGKAVGKPPAIGKPPAVAKPSAVGADRDEEADIGADIGAEEAVGALCGGAKPTMSHEGSRTQYLCRTGVKGPGQSHAIKYGDGIRTKERARLEAVRLVARWEACVAEKEW